MAQAISRRHHTALILVGALFVSVLGTMGESSAALTQRANAWGENSDGQLGDGTLEDRDSPVPVSGLSGIKSVDGGGEHSIALRTDGTIWTFGENNLGQLGNGTVNPSFTPTSVAGITSAKAVVAGGYHNLALLRNGTVRAWGDNYAGQVGRDPVVTEYLTPKSVPGLDNVRAVAAGYDFSVALKENGTVWTWGQGADDALGDGTTDERFTPGKVPDLNNVKAIAAGAIGYHVLVVLENGRVKAWGDNTSGQLGNTTTDDSSTPVFVSSLTNVRAIAAGEYFSLALKENGTVRGWGDNNSSQLGTPDTLTHSETPIGVADLTNVKTIAAGAEFGLALKNAGRVRAWGANGEGQLGNNTSGANVPDPVTVFGLSNVAAIGAGDDHGLAAKG
jgi:alpha-tubulin suppressor-like RCC1 family protein